MITVSPGGRLRRRTGPGVLCNFGSLLRIGLVLLGSGAWAGAANPNCVAIQIDIGQTIHGSLTPTDCPSPIRGAEYYSDHYAFTAAAGQQVAIALDSTSSNSCTSLDPYLYLIGPGGVLIDKDDDGGVGPHNCNSLIPPEGSAIPFITLPTNGVYVIEVTTQPTGRTGNYVLKLSQPCTYSLSISGATMPSAGGRGAVNVKTFPGCEWSSTNNHDWISIISGGTNTGNASVQYRVHANTNLGPRTGTMTIAGQTFTVTQSGLDASRPTVTIGSPAAGAKLTNASVNLQGTARDDRGVERVERQFNGGPFEAANGTTNWSTPLVLVPGTNTVRVRSIDRVGNESPLVTRTFILLAPLSVATNGIGKVTPQLDGKYLEIGKRYIVTALPGVGQVFSNWSGSLGTNSPRLSFLMQTGLVLRANFVPNPFIPVKGTYNGLFHDTNVVLHESSGFFTALVTDRGTFTGSLQSNGKRLPLTGQFDLEGMVIKTVPRPGTNALTVELQLDLSNGTDQITGRISDGIWEAELVADRAVFSALTNPATNYAGKYTLVIPGDANAAASPGGDGFGTASVDKAGSVTFSASLADGTATTQRVPVSKDGHWPLYGSLYGGRGSILSWVRFDPEPTNGFEGALTWIKPALPLTRYYPGGFTNETSVIGSRYVPPVGVTNRVLTFTNGLVGFTGGNLMQPFTNDVTLRLNNKVTNGSSNKLVLTIVPATGLFNGTAMTPDTGRTIVFKGALLQRQDFGAGYFLDTNRIGQVFFGPAP